MVAARATGHIESGRTVRPENRRTSDGGAMVADDPPAIADQGDKYQELVTRWRNPSRWPRFRLCTLLGAVTVFIILVGWMVESQRPSPYVAHFVVPVGFRGAIELIPDSRDGVTVTVRDGNELYVVPRDGNQSLCVFLLWPSVPAYASHPGFAAAWSSYCRLSADKLGLRSPDDRWSGQPDDGQQSAYPFLLLTRSR